MAFTRTTEVRSIPDEKLNDIAQILSKPLTSPAWKKLMLAIPSELTTHEHLGEEGGMYDDEDIRLIEADDYVTKHKIAPAKIFLEEWTTFGRILPTLSHLLQLLIKSELFHAADYVAEDLLSEDAPQRPTSGPAAKINIELPQEDNPATLNLNRDVIDSHAMRSPLVPSNNSGAQHMELNIPNLSMLNPHTDSNIPNLSMLYPHTDSNIPNLSMLNPNTDSNIPIPHLSILIGASTEHEEPNGDVPLVDSNMPNGVSTEHKEPNGDVHVVDSNMPNGASTEHEEPNGDVRVVPQLTEHLKGIPEP